LNSRLFSRGQPEHRAFDTRHNLGDADLCLGESSEKGEDNTGEDELEVIDKLRISLGQNSFGDRNPGVNTAGLEDFRRCKRRSGLGSKVHRHGGPQRRKVAGGAMQLRYISIPALIAAAGGDSWAINQSLQAGRPSEISNLAGAFHAAGRCTAEADNAFEQARSRFGAAWNHQNGDHPIDDSAEVQRVTKSLGAQSLQLPKVGADLENIAATLAEAQRTAAAQIASLEGQLQQLDNLIGQAVEMEPRRPRLAAKSSTPRETS
jgi:hypothetical protein